MSDRLNLNFADEGPREVGEGRVTFSEGAHAHEFAVADFLANQFEALPGDDDIGRGKAQDEGLRRLGGIVGQVGQPGGQMIMQQLPGAVTDAHMWRREELDKSGIAVFHARGAVSLFTTLRELFAQGGGWWCGGGLHRMNLNPVAARLTRFVGSLPHRIGSGHPVRRLHALTRTLDLRRRNRPPDPLFKILRPFLHDVHWPEKGVKP